MTTRRITTTTTLEETSSEATTEENSSSSEELVFTNDHTVLQVFTNGTTGPGNQPWTPSQITTLWKALEPFANIFLPLQDPSYAILSYSTVDLTYSRIKPLRRLHINGCDVYVHTIPSPPTNSMAAHACLSFDDWKLSIPSAWFVQKTHYTDGLGQPAPPANPTFWEHYPFNHKRVSTQVRVTIDHKDDITLPPWPLADRILHFPTVFTHYGNYQPLSWFQVIQGL